MGTGVVSSRSVSSRAYAQRGSVGLFEYAPRLALIIFLLISFASANPPPPMPPLPLPSPPSPLSPTSPLSPSLPTPFSPPLPPAQPVWYVTPQGRRRYPPPRNYAHELQPGGHPTAFAPPNCSAPGWVGCVTMPRPARAKPAAGVRAALLPSACSLSSEPGCLRLPKPLARTGNEPLGSSEAVIRFRESFAVVQ